MILLNEDIWLEIINRLDTSNLLALLEINKDFYSLVSHALSIRLNTAKPLDSIRIDKRWNSQRFKLTSTKFDKYFIKFVHLVDNLVITCSSDSLININNQASIKCNDDLTCLAVDKRNDYILIVAYFFNNQPASCVYRVSIDKPHRIDLLSTVYDRSWPICHSISIEEDFIVYSSFNHALHVLNHRTNQHLTLQRDSSSDHTLSQLKLLNNHLIVITKYSRIEVYDLSDILSSNLWSISNNTTHSTYTVNTFRESDHCLESRQSSTIYTTQQRIIPSLTFNQSTPNEFNFLCKFTNSIQRNDQSQDTHLICMTRHELHKTTFNSSNIYNPITHHYPLQSPSPLLQHFNTDYTVMTMGQFIDVSDTKYFFSIITGGYFPKCTVIDNNFNIVFPTTDAQHMGVIINADFDDANGKVVFCTSQGYVHVLDYLT